MAISISGGQQRLSTRSAQAGAVVEAGDGSSTASLTRSADEHLDFGDRTRLAQCLQALLDFVGKSEPTVGSGHD
jgi:hypothetical protein